MRARRERAEQAPSLDAPGRDLHHREMTRATQSSLLEVLKRHQKRGRGAVNSYLDAVERFYAQVRGWMEPAVKQRLVVVRDGGGALISEAELGEYHAPTLLLDVGPNRVRFVPRGVHAEPDFVGRIDVDSRDRVALIVVDESGAWSLATRTPKTRVELDEGTFATMLAQILGAPRAP